MKKQKLIITHFIIRILPFAYMGFIWYLSSQHSDAVLDTGLTYDDAIKEAMHLIEFGILYLLWVLALLSWGKFSEKSSAFMAVFSSFYGLVDEFHQYFIPTRTATVIDLVKDVIGVFVVWYVIKKAYNNPDSKIKALLERAR